MLQALGAQGFSFQFNDHLGFIHSCPTNCGTGMRASVHVKLPLLSKTAGFKELCDSLRVQARGEHSEHSADSSGVYDISNKERLGKTEVQLVQTMIDGVRTLIQKECELEATCVIGFDRFCVSSSSLCVMLMCVRDRGPVELRVLYACSCWCGGVASVSLCAPDAVFGLLVLVVASWLSCGRLRV